MLYLMLVLIGAGAPYDTHMPHMHSVGTQWGCTYCTVHSVGLHILHCTLSGAAHTALYTSLTYYTACVQDCTLHTYTHTGWGVLLSSHSSRVLVRKMPATRSRIHPHADWSPWCGMPGLSFF